MQVLAAAARAHNALIDEAVYAAEQRSWAFASLVQVNCDEERADFFFGSWRGQVALARARR